MKLKAMKGKRLNANNGGVSLRKTLIVVQLFIAQALIIVVVAITNQIDYFLNVPIGLQTEAIIEFSVPGYLTEDKIESLRTRLNDDNNVEMISFSNTGSISNNTWGTNINYSFNNQPERLGVQVKVIDTTYFGIYDIELVAGSNLKADTTQLLINETALNKMGFENPSDALGLPLKFWGANNGVVVGVVKDFNTNSLHQGIEPVLFTYSPSLFFNGAAKLSSVDKKSIDHIKTEWEAAFPDLIFSYQFLDDNIAQFYENEKRTGRVFSTFGFIALAIGAIGLLGLISFMVNSKIKEIGIRKVLGASVNQVVVMLTKDFVVLTFIAFVLSVPAAYYFLENWLSDFEYRISLGSSIFLMALAVTLIITLLAVSFKALGAAIANPVNALKDE
ncbi:MAG: FtsX-like permease family protein [Fulvivirga sp.]